MKKIIYGLFATAAFLTGMTGCSNNLNEEFRPQEIVRNLSLKVESSDYNNGKLSLGAAPSEITVKVTSNTRWAAEVTDCDGGWCDIEGAKGASDGSFTISVRENMKAVRNCLVKVYKTDAAGNKETDGVQTITIDQVASDVRITPSSLEPFPANPTTTPEFEIISNVPWTLTVSYDGDDTAEFVTITPLSEDMTETTEGVFEGSRNASFRVELQPNRRATNRSAFLILSSVGSKYTVELTQLKSDYTFDVSPSGNQTVPAIGGAINFDVLSISTWKISSADSWIHFPDEEGAANTVVAEKVTVTVEANNNGYQRTGILRFTPTEEKYKDLAISVTIIQEGYVQENPDNTFSVTPKQSNGVVAANGESMDFELNSRFNWETILPGWITADPAKGSASENTQTITLTAVQNATGVPRTGTVTFKPISTEFAGGVTLNPTDLGIEPFKIEFTQAGGDEPVISVPWLSNDYSDTSVTVQFSFISKQPIFKAGLEWIQADEADSENWNDVSQTLDNPNNENENKTVTFDLTNLKSNTTYVARGYVIMYEGGDKQHGPTSAPFTTATPNPSQKKTSTPGT